MLLTLIELIFVTYCLVYLIGFLILDCDFWLAFLELFGNNIGHLKGQVVWITGASSGIGEGLAKALTRYGVRVAISARRVEELERVQRECLVGSKLLSENDILIVPMDITKIHTHQECLNRVLAHFGTLDILVNNAGRSQRAIWQDIELEVDRQMFELNVFGPVSLTRLAVKYFLQKGTGHVAVTSSIAGVIPAPYSATYTGTKHAINGYYGSLRIEKMDTKITVSILCPGPVHTNFLSESFTTRPGEVLEQSTSSTDNRMTADRCGYLCGIALANKVTEAWMAKFPVLPITYAFVYWPNFCKLVIKCVGPKTFLKLRDSKDTLSTNNAAR
ncbi:dehydrogenase/reductase SDR family member 7 [Chrysoperla carnea]|uniref:dehydrogenase/reductase SDR family member 7 n=1 Tax=Chrysoperla carnea TaxID=189513 RepID=UPI001D07D616|nr:dehydrogenase/reductase SDR family member 7 [Chrysoperla carnea]